MNRLLLTDTHFGRRQNSITWLQSQIEFLDKTIIPYLKDHPGMRLIHLGDVFDSRSSISPMVAKVVREKFLEMRSLVKDFYIIAGNHDFFSPNSSEYDSISMVFRDCDINLVIDDIAIADEDMFVPWYNYKETCLPLLQSHPNVKNIYTHADIFGDDKVLTNLYKDYNVFSGHIHIPMFRENLYNLGSCYSLDFSDNNQDRYAYTWDGEQLLKLVNKQSIRFFRIRNKDIFNKLHSTKDYYELYIDQNNMQRSNYQTRISEIISKYKNVQIIPIIQSSCSCNEEFEGYDIQEICEKLIPDHLKDKYNKIKDFLEKD